MLETLESCPSCGHQSYHSYIKCKDFTVTQEEFEIVMCDNCTLLFTNPRPTAKHLGRYYESEEYISHTNTATNIIGIIYKAVRSIALKSKVKLINKASTKGTLLDYGCGTGHFLTQANKAGWQITGIEPSESARANLDENIKSNVYTDINQLKKDVKYNVITLWHVLEHISDLKHTLNLLVAKLADNGKLIVAVPNPDSYDAKVYESYWAAYDVPRHLYHFTQKSLAQLLESMSLKIDYTLPMKFDAFYVSLLSEKYKRGRSNYFNSFINGYKSNSYAKANDNNYSSLIYIISKK
ncbi:class I SAM-dependent methyltransferase [Fulvivirga lutimaris]|uniref:class I SAM-dependent methyltransferase n=1 Tax=Fulvivirga lutimaris TaxID=1819566 RepID=UPI0012BC8535|nr:class I SAM-dependent methyltransferase [Fulvivirga lutimaris]MTI41041.1 class I SAM-dependent methyltransferase [Fulvivirga lutimaris]